MAYDINIQTDGLRSFAGSGTGFNESALIPHLDTADCGSSALDGCVYFRAADDVASQEVMKTVTRAEQLLNGIRHGALNQAVTYEDTEQAVLETQQKVVSLAEKAPTEPGLAQVDRSLAIARRLNAAG